VLLLSSAAAYHHGMAVQAEWMGQLLLTQLS
jgi:hypothetical protein